MNRFLSITALSLVTMSISFAQTAMPAPTNPLKPIAPTTTTMPAATVKPAVEKKANDKADNAAKPKRERSAKQKANDDLMRKCGAERRADIAAGKKDVLPWLKYLPECRKRNPIS